LWKKGIYHGDISLENLMWDDRRKVGVLNDFDLSRFADQKGASGQDNTGTLPFMALDLLSEEGLLGEIPRHYRHEAESFAWCLICLYFATATDSKGENHTRNPHPLHRWFTDWESSLDAKVALRWRNNDVAGVHLAHPNTRKLARALHKYWLDRYKRQFPDPPEDDGPERMAGLFGIDAAVPVTEDPRYEELEDDRVFQEILVRYDRTLFAEPLREIWDDLGKMGSKYKEIDWHA